MAAGQCLVNMLDGQPKPRLGTLLLDAQETWQRAFTQALARHEGPQLGAAADLLAHLSLDGLSQSLLAERVGLSKQAIQQSLDQLERHGLVRREPDPVDRRAKYVVLTEAGLLTLELRRAAEKQAERALRDALGKKAVRQLSKGLRKLSAARASIRE